MKRSIITATAILASLALSAPALAEEKQDCPERDLVESATFEATVKSAGLIVGARWGEGTLMLKDGTKKKFSIAGAKIMEIGAAEKVLKGKVYNMENVHNFLISQT